MSDSEETLMWALRLVSSGNWTTLDTETTGLTKPQVIEWAIVDSSLNVVSGRVKPKKAIEPGAFREHGIKDDDVAVCEPFSSVWPNIESLISGKDIVIYNETYDRGVLENSAAAYEMDKNCIFKDNVTHCAMRRYAAYEGTEGYYGDYKWWKLAMACQHMGIKVENAHTAAGDALMTAKIVIKLAEIARKELPMDIQAQCVVPVPVVES